MKSIVIMTFLIMSSIVITSVFAEPIPEYLNVTVPPFQIIPTDEHGQLFSPKYPNQTVYFHFNATNTNSEPVDYTIEQLVFSDDSNELIANKTDTIHLEPRDWSTVVWKFTPKNVGNYFTNVVVKELPLKGLGYHFVITDPNKTYGAVTVSILDSTKNCTKTCFEPSQISVQPMTIVTWKNNDHSFHIVASGTLESDSQGGIMAHFDDLFQSHMLGRNETFSFLFMNPGKYDYFSLYTIATGTVLVQPDSELTTQDTESSLNESQFKTLIVQNIPRGLPTIYTLESLEELSKYDLRGTITEIKPTVLQVKPVQSDIQTLTVDEISIKLKDTGEQHSNIIKFLAFRYTSLGFNSQPEHQLQVGNEVSVFLTSKEAQSDFANSYAGFVTNKYANAEGTAYNIVSTKQPSPLHQLKSGIHSRYVNCNEGLELIIKSSDGQPACVKPDTAIKLVQRGWLETDLTINSTGTPVISNQIIIPKGIADPTQKVKMIPQTAIIFLDKDNVVVWTNNDETPSTLVADNGNWTTGLIKPGESASVMFNHTGTFDYHGMPHPWQKGTIIVK